MYYYSSRLCSLGSRANYIQTAHGKSWGVSLSLLLPLTSCEESGGVASCHAGIAGLPRWGIGDGDVLDGLELRLRSNAFNDFNS